MKSPYKSLKILKTLGLGNISPGWENLITLLHVGFWALKELDLSGPQPLYLLNLVAHL